jgi:hypothetical protein
MKWQSENPEKAKKKYARYRDVNKETLKLRQKEFYKNNPCKKQKYGKKWRMNNSIQIKQIAKKYYKEKRAEILEKSKKYHKKRLESDIGYRILCMLRSRLHKALKNNQKYGHTLELLGCSIQELKKHLESQFTVGMSWGNHGLYGWHIDHKKPCASFDLTDPEQQKACFHYTNLQPLWAEENLSKSDKIYA